MSSVIVRPYAAAKLIRFTIHVHMACTIQKFKNSNNNSFYVRNGETTFFSYTIQVRHACTYDEFLKCSCLSRTQRFRLSLHRNDFIFLRITIIIIKCFSSSSYFSSSFTFISLSAPHSPSTIIIMSRRIDKITHRRRLLNNQWTLIKID